MSMYVLLNDIANLLAEKDLQNKLQQVLHPIALSLTCPTPTETATACACV